MLERLGAPELRASQCAVAVGPHLPSAWRAARRGTGPPGRGRRAVAWPRPWAPTAESPAPGQWWPGRRSAGVMVSPQLRDGTQPGRGPSPWRQGGWSRSCPGKYPDRAGPLGRAGMGAGAGASVVSQTRGPAAPGAAAGPGRPTPPGVPPIARDVGVAARTAPAAKNPLHSGQPGPSWGRSAIVRLQCTHCWGRGCGRESFLFVLLLPPLPPLSPPLPSQSVGLVFLSLSHPHLPSLVNLAPPFSFRALSLFSCTPLLGPNFVSTPCHPCDFGEVIPTFPNLRFLSLIDGNPKIQLAALGGWLNGHAEHQTPHAL